MSAWTQLTVTEIETALQAPELVALREVVLADNSEDPIVQAIAMVTARVRGYAGSKVGNYLDRDQNLIPPELHLDAVWLVIQTLKLRLGVATPLSEDQRSRIATAEADLKAVALGTLKISRPANPESPSSMQTSGSAEVLPARARRFGGGCETGYRPRSSSGQTLGQAGIVDGVSNTGHYFCPPWITGVDYSILVNKPTTVADSGITDALTAGALTAALAAYLTAAAAAGTYAPKNAPAFTGVPTAPTAAVDTNTTQLATTGFVVGQAYLKAALAALTYAPLASPALNGVPTAPTAAVDTNTTQLATTGFVVGQAYLKAALAASTYAPIANPAHTGAMTIAYGTAATALSPLTITQTWNGSGVVFPGLVFNVTDALSAATSLFLDLQIAGSSKLSIQKSGKIIGNGANPALYLDNAAGAQLIYGTGILNNAGSSVTWSAGGTEVHRVDSAGLVSVASNGGYQWSSTSASSGTKDLLLLRDGAGILALRNGANAQAFRVYNTTDGTNKEYGVFDWLTTANRLTIGAIAVGTGTLRDVSVVGATLRYDSTGQQYWGAGGATNWVLQLNTSALFPYTTGGISLGSSGNRFNKLFANTIDTTGNVNVTSTSASGWSMFTFTDNSNTSQFYLGYGNASAPSLAGIAYAQTNNKDFAVYNNTTEIFRFNSGGGVLTPKTITAAGTTGAQTINKIAGSVNFAAGSTSLVVTNSLVTTNSVVKCQLATNDSTAVLGAVVKTAGSFTIYMKTAPTAETRVDFYVATT